MINIVYNQVISSLSGDRFASILESSSSTLQHDSDYEGQGGGAGEVWQSPLLVGVSRGSDWWRGNVWITSLISTSHR